MHVAANGLLNACPSLVMQDRLFCMVLSLDLFLVAALCSSDQSRQVKTESSFLPCVVSFEQL